VFLNYFLLKATFYNFYKLCKKLGFGVYQDPDPSLEKKNYRLVSRRHEPKNLVNPATEHCLILLFFMNRDYFNLRNGFAILFLT
jgi:hypothetical protein